VGSLNHEEEILQIHGLEMMKQILELNTKTTQK